MSEIVEDDTAYLQERLESGRALVEKMGPTVFGVRKAIENMGLDVRVNDILARYKSDRDALKATQPEFETDKTAAAALKAGFNPTSFGFFNENRYSYQEDIAQSIRMYGIPADHAEFMAKILVLGVDYDEMKAAVEALSQTLSVAEKPAKTGKLEDLAP